MTKHGKLLFASCLYQINLFHRAIRYALLNHKKKEKWSQSDQFWKREDCTVMILTLSIKRRSFAWNALTLREVGVWARHVGAQRTPMFQLAFLKLGSNFKEKTLTVFWVSLELWQGIDNKSGLVDIKRIFQWFNWKRKEWVMKRWLWV